MISVIIMVLLAFIVGLFLCFAFSARFYVKVKERSMRNIYGQIREIYSGADSSSGANENYIKLSSLCEENTISLLILDSTGNIDFAFGNNFILSSRLSEIILSKSSQATVIIEEGDDYILQTAQEEKGGPAYIEMWGFLNTGYIFIARSSYTGIYNSVQLSLSFFGIVCAIVFLFVSIVAYFIIRPYTDSLNNLLTFAKRSNEGDFELKYNSRYNKNDEIGMLGQNIHELSHKLEQTISELKTSNLKLENELKDRMAQEEARKKYMSDVSHELKTPIALISGYAEGLKEGISDNPEDQEYYLSVIIDEAEKMNVLVKKLATLNKLEYGRSEVNLERFNVVEVIDGFLNTMSVIIGEKDINIYFNNEDVIYVWADEFLFEEVLVNYFNNAMNHLDNNRIIRINAEHHDNDNVRVTVFNSGEPIPEEELDKIWGKFYKVDQARTRAYGGSGLGLSIVKAIADSLGRECGVYNTEDGVAFWIDLEAAAYHVETVPEDTAKAKKEKVNPSEFIRHRLSDLHIWKRKRNSADNGEKKKKHATDQE